LNNKVHVLREGRAERWSSISQQEKGGNAVGGQKKSADWGRGERRKELKLQWLRNFCDR